jgi:transposase
MKVVIVVVLRIVLCGLVGMGCHYRVSSEQALQIGKAISLKTKEFRRAAVGFPFYCPWLNGNSVLLVACLLDGLSAFHKSLNEAMVLDQT